ncbi:uncharacterized protein LOC131286045 [Anopheles ziemanni]|uniref:uncharacterized protein LOC131271862 n=1 Tax=Anopheles coustani TaxID=139045 RepID=UPI00265A77AA|nr:uncharacterized protein LOC131271862 [Anopheles coustani]XP_058170890.1 uncharacterized protein LOC131286045 [Anopheles ziemanni]
MASETNSLPSVAGNLGKAAEIVQDPVRPQPQPDDTCQDKFHKVLSAFLNRGFKINNDVYLEMIISHLSGKYCVDHRKMVKSAEVFHWLETTLKQWESDKPPATDIAAFTLQLLAMIVENEWDFARIQNGSRMLDRFQQCIQSNGKMQNPSIKLGHVLVLKAISGHAMGMAWIKQSGSWRICLDYYNGYQTIYITRETSLFIYEVLERFCVMGDYDEVKEIIRTILSPLIDCVWKSPEQDDAVLVNDYHSQKIISPLLNLMQTLFRKIIESKQRTRVAYFILYTYKFERNLWKFTDTMHDHTYLTKIWQTHIFANCARLCTMEIPPDDTVAVDLTFDRYTINFLNYVNFSIRRGNVQNVMLMAETHHSLWRILGERAPEEVVLKNQSIRFGDQILLLQLFPVVYEMQCLGSKELPDYIEKFCTKLYDIACEFTIRLIYACRDIFQAYNLNVTELACKSIQGIVTTHKLPRPRAIIAFQAFVYLLKEFLPDMCCSVEGQKIDCGNTDLILSKPNLLSAIINGLMSLIENYKITWKECIESTTVVNFMLNLLTNPNLPSRLVVLALKLTQISIEHFLAPNLALLMDNISGSGLEHVGHIIYKRLHDLSWEARDSALELLASIVSISEIKFPAFQKHILDCDIIPVVEAAAKNDTEAYVRASALRCLTLMVKIRLLWEHSLSKLSLMNHLIDVIDNESEGIVRREAVNTVREIYANHKIQPQCLDSVFSVLAYAAANDLYWEVKVNALQFWRLVMCRQFQHQGMIDGTFPSVTFSKEHKKIVTLTDREIQTRLMKVLNELSLRGCLGVLLACLGDDCDLGVVKETIAIINKLMSHLNKYNFLDYYQNLAGSPPNSVSSTASSTPVGSTQQPSGRVSVIDTNYAEVKPPERSSFGAGVSLSGSSWNTDSSTSTVSSGGTPLSQRRNDADYNSGNVACNTANADEIIDSIVNLNDMNLLSVTYNPNVTTVATTYVRQQQADDCGCDAIHRHTDLFRQYAAVSAEAFLSRVRTLDLAAIIASRQQWLENTESFSSLLDDVLFSYYAAEVNDADCY